MFIAAQLLMANSRKQPICPPTENWIKKLWYLCMMEFYSALDAPGKYNVSEINQAHKLKYLMMTLI